MLSCYVATFNQGRFDRLRQEPCPRGCWSTPHGWNATVIPAAFAASTFRPAGSSSLRGGPISGHGEAFPGSRLSYRCGSFCNSQSSSAAATHSISRGSATMFPSGGCPREFSLYGRKPPPGWLNKLPERDLPVPQVTDSVQVCPSDERAHQPGLGRRKQCRFQQ